MKASLLRKAQWLKAFLFFILETEDFSLCQIQVISFPLSQTSPSPTIDSG